MVNKIKHDSAFNELFPTPGKWENELVEIMGVNYSHALMELWDYFPEVDKNPGGPRKWVLENYYYNKVSPKQTARKLLHKVYG